MELHWDHISEQFQVCGPNDATCNIKWRDKHIRPVSANPLSGSVRRRGTPGAGQVSGYSLLTGLFLSVASHFLLYLAFHFPCSSSHQRVAHTSQHLPKRHGKEGSKCEDVPSEHLGWPVCSNFVPRRLTIAQFDWKEWRWLECGGWCCSSKYWGKGSSCSPTVSPSPELRSLSLTQNLRAYYFDRTALWYMKVCLNIVSHPHQGGRTGW